MKKKLHPKYFDVEIKCACGNVIKTRSTRKSISLAICSACHPFYTGDEKFVDSAGRVERFQRKYAWTDEMAKTEAAKPRSKAAKGAKPSEKVESRARGRAAPKPIAKDKKEKSKGKAKKAEGRAESAESK